MENVSMLKSDVHRFFLSENDKRIVKEYNIQTKTISLELLDKDNYFADSMRIAKSIELIERYLWKKEKFSAVNIAYKASKNPNKAFTAMEKHKKELAAFVLENNAMVQTDDYILLQNKKAAAAFEAYYKDEISVPELAERIKKALKIQKMLQSAKEIHDNHLIVDKWNNENGLCAEVRSFTVYEYLYKILNSNKYNYAIADDVICAADYGAPQKRNRFVVLGVKKDIANRIEFPDRPFEEKQYRTVRDAISDLEDLNPVFNLSDDKEGLKAPEKAHLSPLQKILCDSRVIKNHITTNTTATAMKRFEALKEGENFHSLKDELKTNTYTDIKRTQNTIYLRLKYDEPCGTVVNVRKSMWVHPTKNRAVSIREAARLQTFPDSFVFCGTKDKQYQQVGNAVPPIMAEAIAKRVAEVLDKG